MVVGACYRWVQVLLSFFVGRSDIVEQSLPQDVMARAAPDASRGSLMPQEPAIKSHFAYPESFLKETSVVPVAISVIAPSGIVCSYTFAAFESAS